MTVLDGFFQDASNCSPVSSGYRECVVTSLDVDICALDACIYPQESHPKCPNICLLTQHNNDNFQQYFNGN